MALRLLHSPRNDKLGQATSIFYTFFAACSFESLVTLPTALRFFPLPVVLLPLIIRIFPHSSANPPLTQLLQGRSLLQLSASNGFVVVPVTPALVASHRPFALLAFGVWLLWSGFLLFVIIA
jgi:hypothetical protein